MKNIATRITSVLSIVSVMLLLGSHASAAAIWKLDISVPSVQTSRSFNVQYTILSTQQGSNFEVALLQNNVQISSNIPPATSFGASGSFAVSVANDGLFDYRICANNTTDTTLKCTTTVSVTVDTTAPGAPTYSGKSRVANQYTVSFTAPTTTDVKEVRLFSSRQTTFVANSATLVGSVAVTPGQSTSIVYTTTDNSEQYHAVQAVDQAGNISSLTGDRGTSVTSTTTATPALAQSATGSAVLSTQTTAPSSGANGEVTEVESATDLNIADSGEVLGTTIDAEVGSSNSLRNAVAGFLIGIPIAGALYLLARKYLIKPSAER